MSHPNALLTVSGRRLLCVRVLSDGWTVTSAARAAGISRQTAHKWLRRFFEHGESGLSDRSSRPARIRERVGDLPVYLSVDIDVLDPAHAPGTGTPEPGGLTTRELQAILRGLDGLDLVGADVVEVAPSYDHAELTALAAANVVYEYLGLFARLAGTG